MKVFNDIKVGLDDELEDQLAWLAPNHGFYRVVKKSVDARQRHNPHLVYSVEVFDKDEIVPPVNQEIEKIDYKGVMPIIIGSGPAGLFAALRFVERGVPCRLLEQGSETNARMRSINRFWRYGEFDPFNNVGFGEGGAGLYSDGKLITRIKSPYISYVMNRLVQFGAPAEIEYLSNPHVGSDRIRRVIPKMREYLKSHGANIHYDTKVVRLLTNGQSIEGVETHDGTKYYSDKIILATGHSAEDMLQHLDEIGVHLEGKSFAIGFRIEHPQNEIDKIQFRDKAGHPKLGAANYRLAHHNHEEDVGVYSFCMCPGGYVLSSGTDTRGVVSNGMSNYNRNSPYANSAIVVTIDHKKSFAENKFGGLQFRNQLESQGLQLVRDRKGSKELPVQSLTSFLNRTTDSNVHSHSCPSGAIAAPLHDLISRDIYNHLVLGLKEFDKNMKGFISPKAQIFGVESRTSCPIRVTRDPETLQSISHANLYPCGEGAGYAGGITSAACDGIKIVERCLGLESLQKH